MLVHSLILHNLWKFKEIIPTSMICIPNYFWNGTHLNQLWTGDEGQNIALHLYITSTISWIFHSPELLAVMTGSLQGYLWIVTLLAVQSHLISFHIKMWNKCQSLLTLENIISRIHFYYSLSVWLWTFLLKTVLFTSVPFFFSLETSFTDLTASG